jgi:hypothetical protein
VCVSALVAGGPVSCAVRRVCRLFLVVASPQGRDEKTTVGHVTYGRIHGHAVGSGGLSR